MATDLTSVAIKDGFSQLLHCDGGLASTETAVLDGDGTSSTLSLGTGSATIAGNLVISGNLTVSGTTTEINTQTLNVADNIVVLNNDVTGTPSQNAGIEVERGTSTNTLLRWNESSDRWQFTNDGSTYYNIPISTEYNNYTLPTASSSVLGGIKVGTNLSIDGNGVLSASGSFTSFTIADSDSTQAIGDGVHIKFAASNSGAYGNSQISGSGTSGSPYLITLYAPDTNTTDLNTLSAGTINTANDSIGFIDADDSNASKKESIADFLTAIAGSGISASSGQLSRDSIALSGLSNVSSATPSTGQYLVYGGSQWEPTSVTAMTSWYLRDGDTTAVQVTNGKYVKFVEGNNLIDINFTDTDSGAVDDEFDVTFTVNSSNITSVGTLTGLTTSGDISISTSSDPALTFTSAESSTDNWKIYIAGSGLKFRNTTDSNTAFELTHANNGVFTGTVTWSGGSSTNANTAYSWGDHASGGYLTAITGQSIKNLLDVASNSPSNGQILQWNSTANYYEPVTLTSSYSWYLRDGDTTAVQVTSGKYVKLVEGTGIDINFTDTSSGAVDDEFDVTITNTLMSSGGNVSGTLTTTGNLGVGISSPTTHYEQVVHIHESSGSSAVHLTNNTTGSTENDGTDIIAYQDDFYIWNRESGGHVIIGTNSTERFKLESGGNAYFTGDLYVNKSSPYIQFGNGGNTTSSAVRIGGDNAAGGRLYLQYNGDSSYIDLYGGHGSTERYRDLSMYARSFTFRTAAATTLGTAFTIDSSQNVFANNIKIGSTHLLESLSQGNMRITGTNSAAVGINLYAGGNHRGWIYSNDSSEIGFLDTSGSWDLKKAMNGSLYVYGSGSTLATFGSADAWGRIQHEGGFTNGVYVYTQHGNFRVDGGHWCAYDDNELDLGASQSSQRWRNLYLASQIVGGFGARTTSGTTDWNDSSNARSGAGYTLLLGNHSNGPSGTSDYFHPHSYEYNSKDGGGNMCQFAIPYIVGSGGGMYMRSRYSGSWGGWVKFHDSNNLSGIARTGNTYGSFNVTDGNNGYAGISYSTHSNKPTVMFANSTSSGGIYYQTTGRWAVFHNYSHNCLGVDTSLTDASYELKVNGDILATGDVVAFSDARWKTEIETISNPIDKIMDMRGVYYRELPKGDKKVSDRRKMGVIAQEILKVAPEVVTYGETNDEYAVDYSKLVGILIEGIKELKQEINELKGN